MSMRLIRLELSGFKSFAKTTVLEFPSRIVAVVGPNGSGKSNIAESIRWVLGEQSMKMLRGKKGEDLIWNGSSAVPRMGKASVVFVFDNHDRAIALDFDEVALSRKIFRDGSNEYAINGSPVRLRDVVEMCARMGLGESKHNLIGQGEVDRVLLATPRVRREMLEEALGLRVYQIKKAEAERKLDATSTNIAQVEGLVREIVPHLKFLRLQARRAEAREGLIAELRHMQEVYFMREEQEIAAAADAAAAARAPLDAARAALASHIADAEKEIAAAEKKTQERTVDEAEARNLAALQDQRRVCERELGRLEGSRDMVGALPEAERRHVQSAPSERDMRRAYQQIRQFLSLVRGLAEEGETNVAILRSRLMTLVRDMERFLAYRDADERQETAGEQGRWETLPDASAQFEHDIILLQQRITTLGEEIARREEAGRAAATAAAAAYASIRERESTLRVLRDREREAALALERLRFDGERLAERRGAYLRERREAGLDDIATAAPAPDAYAGISPEEMRRKIERTRARLEEIGGIDESVVKEYEAAEARHAHLQKELDDLTGAHASLKTLIKELDARVKSDFREGFAGIKKEFHDYFKIIFGGGAARLMITKYQTHNTIDETDGETIEQEDEEDGIEIEVDLPRKRIKGLAMLSGGERALTAVALLFAIAAVNPPPFLVLDETDAALDEANSRRYAAMLRELAKKTQLIVITHNRETMQCAGVLYGVTMGDDGVSRLLSLKLDKAEEYTNR